MDDQPNLASVAADLHQAMAPVVAIAGRINAAVARLPRIEPPPDLVAAPLRVRAVVATITRTTEGGQIEALAALAAAGIIAR